jgi:hypothetical protein
VGVRYTGHEITNELVYGANYGEITHDNSWADFLVGVSMGITISPKVAWSVNADGGFGGSEGSFMGKSSLTWKPLKHWSFSLNGSILSTDYENEEIGHESWYKFEVDQTQFGLSFLYHF